jgi:hypothetical protein
VPVFVGMSQRDLEDGIKEGAWDAAWARMCRGDPDRAARVCRRRWYANLQTLLSYQGISGSNRGWPKKSGDLVQHVAAVQTVQTHKGAWSIHIFHTNGPTPMQQSCRKLQDTANSPSSRMHQ